jgi:enoyl-CoA hydratase/carnithine racemase
MTVDRLSDEVTLEKVAPLVALVTINRPAARNSINATVTQGLTRAISDTESASDICCVILTGAGAQAFCAGADLKAVAAGGLGGLITVEGGFGGFVHARRCKPWIAAVNGLAVAGGFEIAMACDMIVASEGTMFGLPEVKRGLVAAAGGLYRLPRMLPKPLAVELIATGRMIAAERLSELGMINRLAAKGGAIESAMQLAAEICANAPLAIRESLAVARQALDREDRDLRMLSDEAQERIMATEDFREGPRAFIEKRAPRWLGR